MKTIIRTNGLKNHRNDKSDMKTKEELYQYEGAHYEEGYNDCRKDVLGLIDKEIKKCKVYIKQQKGFLKLKEMTNKEWLKGRIEECEYTIEMLEELKKRIKG